MAASDVTIQDGLKHPYLLALVRWCLSSFWSTATVLLHRLITAPQIKAPRVARSRPASYEHLHPEPTVDCQVLHTPHHHTLDVIFVHGLYGSLGNTWRQGEWHTKNEKSPMKVPLRRPHSIPTCQCTEEAIKLCSDEKSERNVNSDDYERTAPHGGDKTDENINNYDNKRINLYSSEESDEVNDKKCFNIKISDKIRQKNLKDDSDFRIDCCSINNSDFDRKYKSIGEPDKLYKNMQNLCNVDEINTKIGDNRTKNNVNIDISIENCTNSDNAREVNDQLYNSIQNILPKQNLFITEKFYNNTLLDDVDIRSYETQAQFVKDLFENSVKVKSDKKCDSDSEVKAEDCKCDVSCEVGCGCVCDDCYSPCWPRDWVSVDYPGARVISINYTSDPYLWRPLWKKESKRLRLHERAEQMISQLLDLGVGERPIIWVGHSKGGLFIKKIYCEAYEAHLKVTDQTKETNENVNNNSNNDKINHCTEKETDNLEKDILTDTNLIDGIDKLVDRDIDNNKLTVNNINFDDCKNNIIVSNKLQFVYEDNRIENINNEDDEVRNEFTKKMLLDNGEDSKIRNGCEEGIPDLKIGNGEEYKDNEEVRNVINGNFSNFFTGNEEIEKEPIPEINEAELLKRASLWHSSAGFMFYSVPHRGSPLADIKTPITARSVELMEICKDCPLVLSLQQSWSMATAASRPAVRSLVETCRTLMSVLYLRIVSVDSADPGIGSLNGVDVDHREICKPSSRSCLLYRELMTLMETALKKH